MKRMFARKNKGGGSATSSKTPAPEASPVDAVVVENEVVNETTPMIEKEISLHTLDSDEVRLTEIEDDGFYDETYGRKIATFLSKYSLYYPGVNAEPIAVRGTDEESDKPARYINPPSLKEAWDYFEYQCLPRRFTYIEDQGEGRKYVLASAGEEEPTKLYPVYDTPIGDMADFGIGVGMYFQSVQFFGYVCLLAGVISIPMMRYYASDTYSPGHDGGSGWEAFTNSFSAVCTDLQFKPCPNCPKEGDDNFIEGHMMEEHGMSFILTNRCELSSAFGYYAFAAIMFVTASVYYFVYLQRKYRIELDESEQTSTDYSIRIMNPPTSKESKDPETWKNFFESQFENVQVSVCTVAVNNKELVEALAKKFKLKVELKNLLPLDVEFDENDLDAMAEHTIPPHETTKRELATMVVLLLVCLIAMFAFDTGHSLIYAIVVFLILKNLMTGDKVGHTVVNEIREVEEEIHHLYKEAEEFEVTDVFVTFETEQMQRLVLETMCVPGFRKDEVNEKFKFEGVVLELEEPDEPSSMRWEDLDVPWAEEQKAKVVANILAIVYTVVGGFTIAYAETHSAVLSTILIVLLNAFTPTVADLLTETESHDTETSFATSAYIKVTLIRWIFTVMVNFAITPFTDIVKPGELIEEVRLLYTAETLQRPILQMFDIGGHIARHLKGPRAKDQTNMNLTFMPSGYSIGEKYTEITKLLFFTFFYAIIFPMGFFYAALVFLVYYWVDKFCILRQWKQGPKINAEISLYSTYYLWITVFAYAVAAAYTVAEFPFDNACLTDEAVPEEYVGHSFELEYELEEKEIVDKFTVQSDEQVYEYCNQNVIQRFGLGSFPPIPGRLEDADTWMSGPQIRMGNFLGWALTAISILVGSSIVLRLYIEHIKPLFDEKWTSDSVASDVRFSDVPEIYGYVPALKVSGLQYPLLLCDVSQIDKELISWSCDYNHYTVINDVPEEHREDCFSTVKNWKTAEVLPPPTATGENNPKKVSLSRIISYYAGTSGGE